MSLDKKVYDQINLSNNGKLMLQNMPAELVEHSKAMTHDGKLEPATFMQLGDSVRITKFGHELNNK